METCETCRYFVPAFPWQNSSVHEKQQGVCYAGPATTPRYLTDPACRFYATAHADDFGTEVDRLRMELQDKDNAYKYASYCQRTANDVCKAQHKTIEKLNSEHNALREAVQACDVRRTYRYTPLETRGRGRVYSVDIPEELWSSVQAALKDGEGTGALAEGTREQMGCAKCDGRGYTITHQKDRATCEPCRGTGKANESEE